MSDRIQMLEDEIASLRGCLWPCTYCKGTGIKTECGEAQASILCPVCHGFNVAATTTRLRISHDATRATQLNATIDEALGLNNE